MTKAECCCALGAAWGSAEQSGSSFGMSTKCEICPARGSQDFDQLCLESGFGPEGQDIDECKTLPGLCENGQCVNTLGSYRYGIINKCLNFEKKKFNEAFLDYSGVFVTEDSNPIQHRAIRNVWMWMSVDKFQGLANINVPIPGEDLLVHVPRAMS